MIEYNEIILKNQERIIVSDYQTVNKSPIDFNIAFMNKIMNNSKNEYYQLIIWPTSSELIKVSNFNFNLKIKNNNKMIDLTPIVLRENFLLNDLNYLEFHIDSKLINNENTFYYEMSHDSYQKKGIINLNLQIDNYNFIDNELIYYVNSSSNNLIKRNIEIQKNELNIDDSYENLMNININTDDSMLWKFSYLEPINEMGNAINNNLWGNDVNINKFEILIDNQNTKNYYNFIPEINLNKSDSNYKLNFVNYIYFDDNTKKVEEGVDYNGIVFNQEIRNQQYLYYELNLFEEDIKIKQSIKGFEIIFDYFIEETNYLYEKNKV